MKHYTPMINGTETDLLHPRSRRHHLYKAETLAWVKAEYRRRERRTLKSITEAEYDEYLAELAMTSAELL